MPDLKPIKVILRRRPERNFESPFPDIKPAYDADPSAFDYMLPHSLITANGGWHHDKVDNLGTGSPTGAAICFLPKIAADAVLALGHPDISSPTEAEVETFWDERSKVYEAATDEDEGVLQAIAAKVTIGRKLSPQDYAALDPDDEARGIRKNHNKTWARYKAKRNITVVT